MSPSVSEINESIGKLLKEADPADLVQMLTDETSLLRLMHNNVNNNRDVSSATIASLTEASPADVQVVDSGQLIGTDTAARDNNVNNNRGSI